MLDARLSFRLFRCFRRRALSLHLPVERSHLRRVVGQEVLIVRLLTVGLFAGLALLERRLALLYYDVSQLHRSVRVSLFDLGECLLDSLDLQSQIGR